MGAAVFTRTGYMNSYVSPFVRIKDHMTKLGIDYRINEVGHTSSFHNSLGVSVSTSTRMACAMVSPTPSPHVPGGPDEVQAAAGRQVLGSGGASGGHTDLRGARHPPRAAQLPRQAVRGGPGQCCGRPHDVLLRPHVRRVPPVPSPPGGISACLPAVKPQPKHLVFQCGTCMLVCVG